MKRWPPLLQIERVEDKCVQTGRHLAPGKMRLMLRGGGALMVFACFTSLYFFPPVGVMYLAVHEDDGECEYFYGSYKI